MIRNLDREYYLNRPVNVMEQNAFMNKMPYIENIPTFFGITQIIEEDKPFITGEILFELKTDSIYFNLEDFKEGDIIRIKLFFPKPIETTNIILDFVQIEKSYTFSQKYNLESDIFYILKVINNQGTKSFKIIDSETEPYDMKYQNYCAINECINQSIAIIEKYLDYHIIYTKGEILVENHIQDIENFYKKSFEEINNDMQKEWLELEFEKKFYKEKIISNKKFTYQNFSLILKGIEGYFGYQKKDFPLDLKRAIQDHSSFLWEQKGNLVYFGYKENGYGSFEFSDITKNILNQYKNLGV